MLDLVRCCKFDPFYSSLPKQTEHIPCPAPSKLTSPDPVCVPLMCLLLPLSSDPSIRILTPPSRPSLTPHDKLAVALQTKLDSFKIPPTCKTSYINITEIKRKNANELVEFLWKLNIFGSDGALELILV